MPRSSRIKSGKFAAEQLANSLIASAATISDDPIRHRKVKRLAWQKQAWYWYDTVGIFHYAVQWVGNTLSRARLVALENGKPTENAKVIAALEAFFNGSDNHGEFLRQAGQHMTVAGEGYIIGVSGASEDEWCVAAATEVKVGVDGKITHDGEDVTDDSLVIRFWRPHPQKPSQSDAPTRPLLPILAQLDELTQYVSAQLDSRLSGAGILAIPSEATFPAPAATKDGEEGQSGLSTFMKDLAEAGAAAKKDRSSASARVPLMLQMPGEFVDKMQHVTLWSELDEQAIELRKEATRTFAIGMDMPPEALTGTADVNHWGAWQIEDSLIKSHSEPLLKLIVSAVTSHYLQPLLIANGMSEEDAATFTVGTDTSDMRLRPNRSKEALELGDRLELSAKAQRRENGFTEDDAPSKDELKQMILIKIASGSPSPEAVNAAAAQLGLNLGLPETAEPGEDTPLRRSLEEHPTNDPTPRTRDADAAALLATAEAAVFRARERAGNRIKSTGAKLTGIPEGIPAADRYKYVTLSPDRMNFVLEDAWSHLEGDQINLPAGVDRAALVTHLDNYTRMMFSSRNEFDRELLGTYLALVHK